MIDKGVFWLLYLCGQQERKGTVREFGMDIYTLLYLKWITSKNLLYGTGNSAQWHVAALMGEEFGGEWIHVCVWLSPFAAVPLKPSALLRGHIPQYEGVIFIWRRKRQHAPVFLPGESLGQRSLVGCSSWCCRVGLSDTHKKDFIRIYCIACPVGNCSSRETWLWYIQDLKFFLGLWVI